jgi:hypothetical protein
MNDIQLAKFLGCFSIGLGALEVIAPRSLIDLLGLPDPPRWCARSARGRSRPASQC